MQIGFHSVGLHRNSLATVCSQVKNAGYSAIELNAERLPWAEPHITPYMPAKLLEDAARTCAAAGLAVSSICAHFPLVHRDQSSAATGVDYVRGCIDLSESFGTRIVHVISGPADEALSNAQNWRSFCDAIAVLADYADKRHVALGVEAVVGQVCGNLADLRNLFSDLSGVNIYVNFDPSHFVVQGINPSAVIDQFGERIIHVHVKDGTGIYPAFTFPPLGRGDLDIKDMLSRLRAAKYSGVLSIEHEAEVFGWKESDEDILNSNRLLSSVIDDLDGVGSGLMERARSGG